MSADERQRGAGPKTIEGLKIVHRALLDSNKGVTKSRHLEPDAGVSRNRLGQALKVASAFGWVEPWGAGAEATAWVINIEACCDDPRPTFEGHIPHVAAFGGGPDCNIPDDGGFCQGDAEALCENCGEDLSIQ